MTTRAAAAVTIWAVASGLAVLADRMLDPHASVVVKIAMILLAGFAYTRLAGDCTMEQAVLVGISWAALSIATEVAVAESIHHGWFELVGSPSTPAARVVLLMAWIAAPALCARHA